MSLLSNPNGGGHGSSAYPCHRGRLPLMGGYYVRPLLGRITGAHREVLTQDPRFCIHLSLDEPKLRATKKLYLNPLKIKTMTIRLGYVGCSHSCQPVPTMDAQAASSQRLSALLSTDQRRIS